MARYILHPGPMKSQRDGEIHYIGAGQLRELYAIPADAKVIVIDGSHHGRPFYGLEGDLHAYPRFDGKYPRHEKKVPE